MRIESKFREGMRNLYHSYEIIRLTDIYKVFSPCRCDVGDIVLLCLDERHDHYVVFNMGNILHFLHSDCLESLGLKIGKSY